MIKLNEAVLNKEYIIIKLTTKWKETQNLGHLGMFVGVKIKVIQHIHDIMRIAVGGMVYIFGNTITDNVMLMPV